MPRTLALKLALSGLLAGPPRGQNWGVVRRMRPPPPPLVFMCWFMSHNVTGQLGSAHRALGRLGGGLHAAKSSKVCAPQARTPPRSGGLWCGLPGLFTCTVLGTCKRRQIRGVHSGSRWYIDGCLTPVSLA